VSEGADKPGGARGDEKGERRRRRRRGGLRIPSDNVPRSPTLPPATPEPESEADPRLAVSVAAAFGGSECGAVRAADKSDE
jgi:hypothetical protein